MGKQILKTIITVLVCSLFCQSLLTSVIVLGWLYRYVQHRIFQNLYSQSPLAETMTWNRLTQTNAELRALQQPPFLFRRQTSDYVPNSPILKVIHGLFHSLLLNIKIGISAILTTWGATLLPCILWATAWYVGWHISFNKLYEESQTGVSLGLLGTLLFMGIMLYVPVAQARHAFTRDWRSYFQLRFIHALVITKPLVLYLLALGYLLSNVLLAFFKALPVFLPNINPKLETLTASGALEYLNQYYFWTGGITFLLIWGLKTAGGKIYTQGLLDLWQKAGVEQYNFHPHEQKMLKLLAYRYAGDKSESSIIRKFLKVPVSLLYRSGMISLILLMWALFSFMPFVSQFANYYPVLGFMNQPLVQLPSFRYVPRPLGNSQTTQTAD